MNLSELLKQAKQELICPTCGRGFALNEIKYRGRVNHSVILQAVCANGHFPVVLVFVPSQASTVDIKPITPKDVKTLEQKLTTFTGDFNSVWK